ncbi:MAG TPA: SCO family protein [Gemmataceae bacterium]|nr:SCO family protein [Gemmataceae bacterium]
MRMHVLPLGMLLLCATLAQAQPAEPAPNIGIEQHLNDRIPLDLVFRDEQGKSVTLSDYFGKKPVILVLAYYRCPRLCSMVLNGLVSGLRQIDYEIGDQFAVVTVSIDPREQPELAAAKKEAYVQQYGRPGAANGWHFLTGEEQAIKRLADAVGFKYAYDARHDEFAHGSGIMMLTPDGTLSRYFYGIQFPAKELRFGLEDSSAGKIGSPVVRPLRLLCFTYDPVTGTYTLMTMRLMRLAGVLTVLGMTFFVVRAWRRERRKLQTITSTTPG